jgi:PAS domain-containing protein
MLVIGYYLAQLKITNLKIAGETPYMNAQCMAVRKDWAILAGILQKALDSISEAERDNIYRKWLPILYEHGFNYTLFWQTVALFSLVVLVLAAWIWKLLKEIKHRKKAEIALIESEKKLREAQKLANLGYWRWDIKTGNVVWSEEVYRIFRLDPETFTPRIDSILALSPWPEDHHRDKELIRKATENHETGFNEQRFLHPDGSIGYYYSTFQGDYDNKGISFPLWEQCRTLPSVNRRRNCLEKVRANTGCLPITPLT